jgi:hypothetical protein
MVSLAASLSLILGAACSARDPGGELPKATPVYGQGSGPVFLEETYNFGSLKQLVATADIIVTVDVSEVGPGRIVGGEVPDAVEEAGLGVGDGAIQYARVELSVVSVLAGNAPNDTLVIEELPWVELPESRVGQRGVYFLIESDGDPHPFIISSEGRYLVSQDGTMENARGEPEGWILDIEAGSLAEFEQAIREAQVAIERDDTEPLDGSYE